jgi:hypothetical protein
MNEMTDQWAPPRAEMYCVVMVKSKPDGTAVSERLGVNFETEAEAEKVAFGFLGLETVTGLVVASQVWELGPIRADGSSDKRMLNEFEA